MKKKLFIAAIAVVAGAVLSVKGSVSLNNLSISELVSLNQAQASCFSNSTMGGRCNAFNRCIPDPDPFIPQTCATAGSPDWP